MLLPLRRYAQFSGRARRKEFWLYLLGLIVALLIASALDGVLGLGGELDRYWIREPGTFAAGFQSRGGWISLLVGLGALIPTLAVTVRRLHDADKSGWLLLLSLIPVIGGLILLFFYVQPSTPGTNRFGPDPATAGGGGA
jgi:uncharacterized membrane protein YhaH (DUF805 family)